MREVKEMSQYHETYKHYLGTYLRKERLKRRWTIFYLAGKCNLSPTYLGEIINGKKNPSLEVLLDIANGLGVPMSEMFLEVDLLMKGEDENVRNTL